MMDISNGLDDLSWGNLTFGPRRGSQLLRSIVMEGCENLDSNRYPFMDGHCYMNDVERLVLTELKNGDARQGSCLDLIGSVGDERQPVFESEVITYFIILQSFIA